MAISAFAASTASASRAPTAAELKAIRASAPAGFLRVPTRCGRLAATVSTADTHWATVGIRWTLPIPKSCAQYEFNGIEVMRLGGAKWRYVTEGSDFPCAGIARAGIPRAVARDLRLASC
jgi:hypothetical protein